MDIGQILSYLDNALSGLQRLKATVPDTRKGWPDMLNDIEQDILLVRSLIDNRGVWTLAMRKTVTFDENEINGLLAGLAILEAHSDDKSSFIPAITSVRIKLENAPAANWSLPIGTEEMLTDKKDKQEVSKDV
jgi:hypothetical protein